MEVHKMVAQIAETGVIRCNDVRDATGNFVATCAIVNPQPAKVRIQPVPF